MNGAINFTATFSHGVEWGWPIAVYLLLAGMSGGALVVALLVKFYKKQTQSMPLFKAASLLSFITSVKSPFKKVSLRDKNPLRSASNA